MELQSDRSDGLSLMSQLEKKRVSCSSHLVSLTCRQGWVVEDGILSLWVVEDGILSLWVVEDGILSLWVVEGWHPFPMGSRGMVSFPYG